MAAFTAAFILGASSKNTAFCPLDQTAAFSSAAAQTGKFEAEGWRVRKDESRFWACFVINAIKDANGEIVGFAKITRDLTERRARR
ncbi:hypothetical protein KIP88_42425 [Bradyrhizobium sp. SRL28]|nr:PAS domain-containing protein [Bradyrhizobium sp. SRL28]MBT1517035.1 hypothetical protein [Bradyrhizobium sp. SRL28]